jgi:hypothetical protein
MDPNANLQAQERLLTEEDCRQMTVRARVRELRAALSGWLSAGGFAPDWIQAPTAAHRHRPPPGTSDISPVLETRAAPASPEWTGL